MNTLFSIIPRLALVFGRNKAHALYLLLQFWFFFLTRKVGLLSSDMAFRFYFNHRPFVLWLRHPMDVAVLREIYIDKEYDWCPVPQPRTIVDLGAHFGDTTLYYHTRFPEARIIAVEPAPESFERLVKNTKAIPQIIPVQAAISDYDGEMALNIMPSSLGNSLSVRKESTASVQVQTMTLDSLLGRHGIETVDLLKFDIEGAEFGIFKDFVDTHKIKALIGEVHEDLGSATIEEFKNYFSGRQIAIEQLKNKKRYIVNIQ